MVDFCGEVQGGRFKRVFGREGEMKVEDTAL